MPILRTWIVACVAAMAIALVVLLWMGVDAALASTTVALLGGAASQLVTPDRRRVRGRGRPKPA